MKKAGDRPSVRSLKKARPADARWQELVERMPHAAAAIGPSGVVLCLNERFVRLFGYSRDDVGSTSDWWPLVHPDPDYRRRVIETWETVAQAVESTGWELEERAYRVTCKGGLERSVLVSGREVDGDLVLSFVDVTERRNVERALERSRASLAAVLESTRDMIWSVDVDLRLQTYNATFVEHVRLQYGTKAVVGIGTRELLSPARAEVWEVLYRRAIAGEIFRRELVHPDGRVFEATLHPIISSGQTVGVSVFSKDVTEQKRMLAVRVSREQRLHSLFEGGPPGIGMFRSSLDGRLLEVNAAQAAMCGYDSPEEMLVEVNERGTVEALWPSAAVRESLVAKAVAAAGRYCQEEVRVKRKDGTFLDAICSQRLADDPETCERCMTGFIQDISERKQAEEARAMMQARLFQAQKMELVGRLSGGVAHDFNNMLAVIMGQAGLALAIADPPEAVQQALQEIMEAARRSADLTRQLLTFSRREAAAPRVLDLNDATDRLVKMLRRLIGVDTELVWVPAGARCNVRMDPSHVDQILINLCVNARDAIQGVGRITVETTHTLLSTAECQRHPGALPGEYVALTVTDTGRGMTSDLIDQIFEPFFTTKDLGEGTGLGLATVASIVRDAGGGVDVSSEPGRGSRFQVLLPRVPDDALDAEEQVPDSAPRGRGEVLLVVDDNESLRMLYAAALQTQGYRVLGAAAPEDALRLAELHGASVRLLVADVIMPQMSGVELAQRVRQTHPGLPCLFVSGHPAHIVVTHGASVPGAEFLQKPFSLHALATKIRAMLDAT